MCLCLAPARQNVRNGEYWKCKVTLKKEAVLRGFRGVVWGGGRKQHKGSVMGWQEGVVGGGIDAAALSVPCLLPASITTGNPVRGGRVGKEGEGGERTGGGGGGGVEEKAT
ncbi:hypothetical protein CBR_g6350 [Chara braunii]|uniref:Uncharacterized protein n=1 Tax=Chara braunii TaxID=69332 RepID=A0A388KJP9_CHABU|nr:hypothetical protein CBR_g6350 [Chara braunii]|eukprot:GBG70218.1 hypothetical protein CBR_g6350 [Chara braunii]